MTTSRHDLRYGRQGGRVVDWVARAHPIELGALRRLDLGEWGIVNVVVAEHLDGDRLLVTLPHGAQLIVKPEHLERPTT